MAIIYFLWIVDDSKSFIFRQYRVSYGIDSIIKFHLLMENNRRGQQLSARHSNYIGNPEKEIYHHQTQLSVKIIYLAAIAIDMKIFVHCDDSCRFIWALDIEKIKEKAEQFSVFIIYFFWTDWISAFSTSRCVSTRRNRKNDKLDSVERKKYPFLLQHDQSYLW